LFPRMYGKDGLGFCHELPNIPRCVTSD
jgi:hypothetical protein